LFSSKFVANENVYTVATSTVYEHEPILMVN
jgi:hypothetical protein